VRARLSPALGGLPLGKISPDTIRRFLRREAEGGRRDGKPGPISARTIQLEYAILRQALEAAVRLDIIARNPADRVQPPKSAPRQAQRFAPEEIGRILETTEGTRLHGLWVLLFGTGLRIGEALALTWEDVDLDRLVVQVRRSKTQAGIRSVPIGREVADALRAHRALQLRERLAAGPLWEDHGLVFPTTRGTPQSSDNVRRRDWARALAAAGLPHRRLHEIRHTAGSMILEEAADSKAGLRAAQDMLGHASASFMLQRYAHSLPAAQREVAERLGRRLRSK
jgi:integrase